MFQGLKTVRGSTKCRLQKHSLQPSYPQQYLLVKHRLFWQSKTSSESGAITQAYQDCVSNGNIRADLDQIRLAEKLDSLHTSLVKTDGRVPKASDLRLTMLRDSRKESPVEHLQYWMWRLFNLLSELNYSTGPKGLYIYGAVGVGKSFLMDLFYGICSNNDDDLDTNTTRRKFKRVHFHEFMLDVHSRIHNYRQQHPKSEDALAVVALELAKEARVLCFDEFQVTDIADAMILQRLFGMLWDLDVVVLATSNRAPEDLYQGGINRSRFLPFVDNMKSKLNIIEMPGQNDYRRDRDSAESVVKDSDYTSPFLWPSRENRVRKTLREIFVASPGEGRSRTIPVQMGRVFHVPKATNTIAWLEFDDLCGNALGAADYMALCDHFDTLIIDHVPQLTSQRFNEARRFVTLIDAMYESKTNLIMSTEVPPDDLFVGFEATVETNDGDEEIAVQSLEKTRSKSTRDSREFESFVKGEGGSSSSSSTTMIQTNGDNIEWSATGRIGVSLAQLSAVQDVSFSFQRAASRLAEMNRPSWGS